MNDSRIKDFCDTINSETSLELSNASNDTIIQSSSQSNNLSRELEEIGNSKIFEVTENNTTTEENMTEENMIEGNMTEGNMTEENMTEGNMIGENVIRENVTEGNVTEGNVTEGNVTEGNVTEKNVTENINLEDTESTDIPYLQYDWSIAPKLLYVASEEYRSTDLCENFTKGCQWSPDGTCLFVPSEDFGMRIYELPREFYSGKIPSDFTQNTLVSALTVKEGGLIYDACWYPYMSAWDPSTCCFLSTSKESPIHLWDAITGELRATYRAYNQVDEVEAAISIQFVNSGSEIWSGFKNTVRTFDTNCPGRQIKNIHFKHDFPNMNGLVSCIRENPIMPGLVALGSYSKCIGLYKDEPICIFETASGVTQVEFSSCGTKLYSAVRKNNEFLCWDLRKPGNILYCLQGRQCDTNQRIKFSVTPDDKHMISGGTDGSIMVWELSDSIAADSNQHLYPKYKITVSKDCINGISLHRNLPILATSSGQRHCCIENMRRDNSVRLWWVS